MLKTLKNPEMSVFNIVWLGQLVSILGSNLTNFALDIWVYQHSDSVTQLSLLFLFTTLPNVLLSPFIGVVIDKYNRRLVMIFSDSGVALITLIMFFLLLTGKIEIWHIYLANTVSSICNAFQAPAFTASTTLLVPKQHLARANGMNELSEALGELLSPVLAGVFLGIIHLSGIIALDLGSFLFALTTLLLVRFPSQKLTEDAEYEEENNKISLLQEVTFGFNYLKTRSGLLALLFFFTVNNFLTGILTILAYPLILSFATTAQLGVILSIGGVGTLVGSLIIITWGSEQKNYINILFFFMLVNGFAMMLAGSYPSVILLIIAAFMFFMAIPFVTSSAQVIFQKKVAPEVQGRVFSVNSSIATASLPLASLVAGPLADRIFEPLMSANGLLAGSIGQFIGTGPGRGIGLMFIILGILTMLVTIIAYQYSPLRRVELELPDA